MFSMIKFAFQSYTDIIKIYKNLYKFHTIHSRVLLNNFFFKCIMHSLISIEKTENMWKINLMISF